MVGSLPEIGRSAAGESQFDWAFSAVICARLAAGESLRALCRDPDMPSVQTVAVWRRNAPEFAAEIAAARREGQRLRAERREGLAALKRRAVLVRREGLARNAGRTSTYDYEFGLAICTRIALGESLEAVCRDPDLPAVATVYNWLRRWPEFARAYRLAREMQLDLICGEMRELADGATPETVGVVRLKIAVLKDRARRLGAKGSYAEPPPVWRVTTVRWEDVRGE